MNSHDYCNASTCDLELTRESRSSRFNLPVRHPSKWALLRDVFLSPPHHTYRYRLMSNRMLENTMRQLDRRECR